MTAECKKERKRIYSKQKQHSTYTFNFYEHKKEKYNNCTFKQQYMTNSVAQRFPQLGVASPRELRR